MLAYAWLEGARPRRRTGSRIGSLRPCSSPTSASCNRTIGTCRSSSRGFLKSVMKLWNAPSAQKAPQRPYGSGHLTPAFHGIEHTFSWPLSLRLNVLLGRIDLPIEFPTKMFPLVNLKTAKALGLDVPPMRLARADEVME